MVCALTTGMPSPWKITKLGRLFLRKTAFCISPVRQAAPGYSAFSALALRADRSALIPCFLWRALSFLAKDIFKIVECPRHSWSGHFLPFSFINGLISFDSPVLLWGTSGRPVYCLWLTLPFSFSTQPYLFPACRTNLCAFLLWASLSHSAFSWWGGGKEEWASTWFQSALNCTHTPGPSFWDDLDNSWGESHFGLKCSSSS